MLKRGAGPLHDGKSEDSNTGKLIPAKHLKRSGGAAAPPIMIEKVMIQFGAHFNLCQKSKK